MANKTVREIKVTPDVSSGSFRWIQRTRFADASMANVENKSQGGFIVASVDKKIKTGDPADFSINSWRSHKLRRVVKATLGIEALALDDAELEWLRVVHLGWRPVW